MTDIDNKIKIMDKLTEHANAQAAAIEYETLDRRQLSKMTDKELAKWQAKYQKESPQSILADHEWNRRLTAEQVSATRFSAWIGLVGVILGFLLGLCAQYSKPIETPKQSIIQTETTTKNNQQGPVSKPKLPSP